MCLSFWQQMGSYRQLRKNSAIALIIGCLLLVALSVAYLGREYQWRPRVKEVDIPTTSETTTAAAAAAAATTAATTAATQAAETATTAQPSDSFGHLHAPFWRSLYTSILSNDPECSDVPIEPVVPYKLDIGYNAAKNHARPDLLWIRPDDLKKLKDSHAKFVSELPSIEPIFYRPGTRGIVFTAGLKQLPVLLISVRMIRRTGCQLPIEVFLASDKDYDKHVCSEVLPSLNAKCLTFTDIFKAAETGVALDHYQFKIFALIFGSFEEVLLLDSDAFPASDPTTIFTSEPFTSKGMIIWPDFWYPSESPYYFEIANLGTPPALNAHPSVESGELVFSKSRHNFTLMLATYYNFYGPSYYYPLQSQGAPGQGDKETFGWAALATNNTFYQVREPVSALGHFDSNKEFFGSAMAQHDPIQDFRITAQQSSSDAENKADDRPKAAPLFVHANFPKFDPSTIFEYSTQAKGAVGPTFDSNNTAIRTWGAEEEMVKRFGYDVERAFWEEIEFVACDLEEKFIAWRGKEDICFGVREYRKTVFPKPDSQS